MPRPRQHRNCGIYAGGGSTLSNCSAHKNKGAYGIFADSGSTLSNCSAFLNDSAATISAGIGTGNGCTVTGCTSYFNTSIATSSPTTGMGFDLGARSTIQNCTATSNKGDGIRLVIDSIARETVVAPTALPATAPGFTPPTATIESKPTT